MYILYNKSAVVNRYLKDKIHVIQPRVSRQMEIYNKTMCTIADKCGELSVHTPSIQEEFEDTKGVIRICKSKKDRQHNGQKKKYKQQSRKHTK